MLQYCVVENSLVQDIFNITKIMDILQKYHAKHESKFDFINMASSFPNGEHEVSPQLLWSGEARVISYFAKMFPNYENRVYGSSWQYLNDL